MKVIRELDGQSFQDMLGREGLAVVEFYLSTCPHCLRAAPMYERAAEELAGTAAFGRVEARKHGDLALENGVEAVPTFQLFCGGRRVAELTGVRGERSFRRALASMVEEHGDCPRGMTPLEEG